MNRQFAMNPVAFAHDIADIIEQIAGEACRAATSVRGAASEIKTAYDAVAALVERLRSK